MFELRKDKQRNNKNRVSDLNMGRSHKKPSGSKKYIALYLSILLSIIQYISLRS